MTTVTPEKIAQVAQKLPTAPQTFNKLEKVLRDPNKALSDIVELLRVDMTLSASILRVANSAVFSRGSPVETLEDAINRIGFREVHRFVAAAAATHLCQQSLPYYALTGAQLWENSLATALAAEALARRPVVEPQSAYTASLLRTIGKLVLNNLLAREPALGLAVAYTSAKGTLPAWEAATTSLSSPEVGAVLLEKWGFPAQTAQAVRHQYQPTKAGAFTLQAGLVHVASWVAAQLGRALPGEQTAWSLPPALVASLRLDQDQIAGVIPETHRRLTEMKSALSQI